MTTAQPLFRYLTSELSSVYDRPEAQAIAYRLLDHYLALTRTAILLDSPLTKEQPDWTALLIRLKAQEPVQYVLGEAFFYGRSFEVTPATLIPRPETEELIQRVLQEVQNSSTTRKGPFLDIGTGTGCIAITLALELPEASVLGWDVSPEALQVARRNATRNDAPVVFEQVDVRSPLLTPREPLLQGIVSNPPYVSQSEAAGMQTNVLAYEPHLALFVPDEDPLLFYKAIADLGLKNITDQGFIFVEINEHFGPQTTAVFLERGYASATLFNDLSGKPRFVRAIR